jgi:PAS domain S-box-containing protein
MDNFEYYISGIRDLLKLHPGGMTVSDIAQELHMSRNTIGKYLEIMCLSGETDARAVGKAKIYFLAPRIPVTRILGYLPDAVIQTDHGYRIVYANLAAMALLQDDEKDLAGRNILDLLCLQGMTADMRGRVIGNEEDGAFTTGLELHPGDRTRFFWMTVAGMVMQNGTPGYIFIFHDISEWKEAEEKKKEFEFLFSTLSEETYEQVCIYSPGFTVRYANPRYESAWKRDDGTPAGSDLLKSCDRKTAQMLRDTTDSVLELRSPRRFVFPVTQQGITRWLDTRLYPVPIATGEIRDILGIIREVTGFQEGGSASALLSSLLKTMAEGVLTVTAGGTILTWNRGAEAITGYPADELLGGMAQIIIPPELNRGVDVINETVRGKPVTGLKMTIRAKGGRKKKVIMSTSIVADHTGEISQVVLVWHEP